MAKKEGGGKGKKGNKKYGREIKKRSNRGSTISLFVRNRITAEEYFRKAGLSLKRDK